MKALAREVRRSNPREKGEKSYLKLKKGQMNAMTAEE